MEKDNLSLNFLQGFVVSDGFSSPDVFETSSTKEPPLSTHESFKYIDVLLHFYSET